MEKITMASTEAQKRASRKYTLDKSYPLNITLNRKYDAEIIARLEEVANTETKAQYVRRLIREDIERQKTGK